MNHWLDWVVLGLYLFTAGGLGLWLSGKNKNFADFMFGSGQVPWLAVGISLIATSVSATTFLGNPAQVIAADMTYFMCNVGVFIAIYVVAVVFIPRFRSLNVESAYELLEARFSRPVRLLAAGLYVLHLLLRTGILIYGPALVLSQLLGMSMVTGIILTSTLAIAYTWFGGIQAVIWTDVMQFCVLMAGGIVVLWVAASEVGGFSEMFRIASDAQKTKMFDFSMDPSSAKNILSAGIVYAIFEVAIRGCDQQFIQRYMSCKSQSDANRSSFASAFFGLLVGLLFFWVGAALYAWMQVQTDLPELGVNEVFPYFIAHVLPPGVTGLLVAAIFAAAMSSLDSAVTALSNTTLIDFLGFEKGAHEKKRIRLAKLLVVFWGVLGVGAALLAVYAGEDSLLKKALFFTSLFTGPLLGIFLLAFFRPRTNPNVVFASAFFGMTALLPFQKLWFIPSYEPLTWFSWPWNPLISMGSMLLSALILDQIIPRRGVNVTA